VTVISTHVLDTALGRPAAGVHVRLQQLEPGETDAVRAEIAATCTDDDGRVSGFGVGDLPAGTYRLQFDTASYYQVQRPGEQPFYPVVTVTFTVHDQSRNYHVPLLLSPFGYSTYRGS